MGEGNELESQPASMFAYRSDDPFGRRERFLIAESQDGPAEAFQLHLPEVVPQHDIIPFVNAAVDLQDEPKAVAGEVGEVAADRVLAAEAVAVDLPAAEPLP